MSRTLADVEVYQVYLDEDGEPIWRDGAGYAYCRRKSGNIHTLHPLKLDRIAIVGDSLGHVRDEPWRKADAEKPGSLADAHNRIDAAQTTIAQLIGMAKAQIQETKKLADRITSLEERPGEPVETINQCNTTPVKPTQPPDVAVYRKLHEDGGWIEVAYLSTSKWSNRPTEPGERRTVLDAFDRLTWDELRRWGLNVLGPAYDIDTWDILRIGGQTVSKHPTEREALTASRAIARKEGWR